MTLPMRTLPSIVRYGRCSGLIRDPRSVSTGTVTRTPSRYRYMP
ncbi:hypothetical protein SAMN05446589_5602 [Streptomyces sp. OV198]|jgi:hypothetical protein|nr:hypothetical protein BX281_7095 [Streptomyces sp. Ag82_O1-15]SOE75063.1 hypothetical protein SAMN05446589_5602 [Streptomyces sp. OV198]